MLGGEAPTLGERGASTAYQHRRHREVKASFSWGRRMGLVEEDVFALVPLVRLEQKIIEPFSEAEVAALLGSQNRSRYTGCRNFEFAPAYPSPAPTFSGGSRSGRISAG